METIRVKDIMVPLSEYATVPLGSTLYEAVLALEKAQEEFDNTKYRHRGVLVMDRSDRVIGKLSHMDALRALEPKADPANGIKDLIQFGFSPLFVADLRKKERLKGAPLSDLCHKTLELKVEDFMRSMADEELIDLEASLDIAIHQLVLGNYLSLLVTENDEIIGILRLTDVFAAVFHTMKTCEETK
jgi:CBS domain containing-hemolysin-like protein